MLSEASLGVSPSTFIRRAFAHLVHGRYLVSHRVAHQVEPAPATATVTPLFLVAAFGVLPVEQIVAPHFVRERIRLQGANDVRLATKAELALVAQPAIRTFNLQHRALVKKGLMSDAGRAVLVDERAGAKSLEGKRRVQGMWRVVGDGVREHPSRTGCRLEAPSPLTAVEVQTAHRGFADDRARIWRDVDDTALAAQHPHSGEHREQFDDSGQRSFDDVEAPTLPITVKRIDASPDNQLPFI